MANQGTKEIVKRSKIFVDFMNKSFRLMKAMADAGQDLGLFPDDGTDFPKVTFEINRGNTGLQTPEHKANGISKGRSSTCKSSHLVDKARHINTRVNGKVVNQKGPQMKALGKLHPHYQKTWAAGLKHAKLRNYNNKLVWAKEDPPHVELPNSKIKSIGNPLVQKCFDEYAKLTRKDGKKINKRFESKYAAGLKKYIEKWEKLAGSTPNS